MKPVEEKELFNKIIKQIKKNASKNVQKANLNYLVNSNKKNKQSELNNLAEDINYKAVKDSLINVLKFRIADANKVPLGLGRQLDDAKPWGEPARFFSKKK